MTFKINKPFSDSSLSVEQKINSQNFVNNADNHLVKNLDPDDKKSVGKQYRIFLNEYDEGLMIELSKKLKRSKAFLVKAFIRRRLREELGLEHNEIV
jgi:hypothetical protein